MIESTNKQEKNSSLIPSPSSGRANTGYIPFEVWLGRHEAGRCGLRPDYFVLPGSIWRKVIGLVVIPGIKA